MNANDLTFGVEIETLAPTSLYDEGLRIGNYHHGIQVLYLPQGWTAERDNSLHHDGMQGVYEGCEIVSPILRGREGLEQVALVLRTLEAKGHRVNASCGVHVHIGWSPALSAQALARLVTIAAHVEKGLYAITGTKARERGLYCGGVRKYRNDKEAKKNLDEDRYHALNLTNLATGRRPTVEFRVFSGTTSVLKVLTWIMVCLGLVERAINGKRSPAWEPKAPTGGWKKAGPGQSETERLMGYLAWGAGYAKLHGGHSYGWIENEVTQDQARAELRRLAKRYDAMA